MRQRGQVRWGIHVGGAVLAVAGAVSGGYAVGAAAPAYETGHSGVAAPLHIEEFLPRGRASGVEAVQVRFSAPAAAFGDPGAQAPVDLSCEGPVPPGQGRWLDDRRWSYSFERAVPSGVHCLARANPAFRSLAGQPLSAGVKYEFNTGAPAVTEFRPYQGMDIDEEQVFILRFDGPVDPHEVARHSHCAVEGIAERIPVEPVSDEHRESLMKASYLAEPDDPAAVALLQCTRVLPPDSEISLMVGPGIRARGQPATVAGSERARELEYTVRPSFMARLSCSRERAGRPCLPIAPISVSFSAPVPHDALAGVRLSAGDAAFEIEHDEDRPEFVSYLNFPGPFPPNATLTLSLPDDLRDDAGRALSNADRFPLTVSVTDYPPLAKFASGTFGVIERFAHAPPQGSMEAAAVPVTLRHIETDPTTRSLEQPAGQVAKLVAVDDAEVLRWYARLQRLDGGTWSEGQLQDILADREPRQDYGTKMSRVDARSVSLLKTQPSVRRLSLPAAPEKGPRPFEVVGIPLQEPGFHVLEIESPRLGDSLLGDDQSMYVRTGVLLTNLSLHVKQGRDDLLVWVTTLSDAEAVPGAEISVLDCNGRTLARGHSDAQGVWHHLAALEAPSYCQDTGLDGLFVSARVAADHPQAHGKADYAFVMSGWDRGIETWRFNVPTSSETAPTMLAHTVFDRSLFRAGEQVSMKHYLREETRDGLRVPHSGRPDRLVIEHEGSSQRHEIPIDWRETPSGGLAASSEFDIPESAHLGSYSVRLTDDEQGWYGSSRFRVEEFRLPILAGRLAVRGGERPDILVDPRTLEVDMQLAWLSGGAASGQKVALSAVAEDRAVHFENYDDYRYMPPPRMLASGTDAGLAEGSDADDEEGQGRRLFLDGQEFVLDANGTAAVVIDAVPRVDRPQRFRLEASFADPNGEIQTLSGLVDVWPSAVQAGLKAEGWERADRDIPVSLIALGIDAKPRPETAMKLLAVERKTHTVRKRMVGGFYRYDSHTEREEVGTVCEGVTDASGTLSCTVRFDRAGAFELVAVAEDEQGRVSRAYSALWVSGSGELWFEGQDDDRIDLIPAKREWTAGEEAEFQVRMPFREAVALVSVEREGVLWTQQVTLKGSDPVVKIPVSASWGPNAYVSVLVLRGRLYELPWQSFFDWGWRRPAAWLEAYGDNPGDMLVTNTIDLARPAFRFGLAEMKIASETGRLQVELTPQQDVLQVRQEAVVGVRATLPDGQPAAHATVAFAAVDEALLELAPNDSWSLYEAMHPRRSLGVRTATTQMEVVGRRHYGRKAVAAGGGGGMLPTRQLFDTLLSWQPTVQLDANGEAEVRFRMNDSLSRFRLVAVADHGSAHFGTAESTVVTRQDLQLVSGLPPVVREGDEYRAVVTVSNGSKQGREVEIMAVRDSDGQEERLPPRTLQLEPGESGTVSWPVSVPALAWPNESGILDWRFEAGDGSIADSVAVTQRIEARLPTSTVQAALLSLEAGKHVGLPVSAPSAALRSDNGRPFGGIALDVSGSLLGGLQGVREWWLDYAYTCLEQTASQAIALNDSGRWRKVVAQLATHMDDDGLLRYFPGTGPGSEVLTAYLVSASDDARRLGLAFDLPEDMLQRMLEGLQAFAEGRIKRTASLSDTSLDSRRIMAMEALSRHGRVTPAMLTSLVQAPDEWPTPTVVDWLSILIHMSDRHERRKDLDHARSLLVSRMSVSGAAMVFSDVPLNAAPGLMASRVTSLARLMFAVMDRPEWQDDLPRMAQGLLGAQSGGAWAMTTENLLAGLALARFAGRFEATPAAGRLTGAWENAAETASSEADDIALELPQSGETVTARLDWPHADERLRLSHEGQGRVWVALRAQARVPLAEPQEAGYRVLRRIVPVQRSAEGAWSRGDVYRVELEIHSRDAANWVVLSDPVPAGGVILGSGLGRDARAHLSESQGGEYYPPAFVERAATGYRAYFDYLPAGRVQVSYTVRLNAIGSFVLPPTRVEALYRPDLYGSFPNHEGMAVGAGTFDAAASLPVAAGNEPVVAPQAVEADGAQGPDVAESLGAVGEE